VCFSAGGDDMTGRIQLNRSSVTNYYPPATTREVGELFINYADQRLMMIDPTKTAQDLLAIRRHAATASYATGDFVTQGGDIWKAKAPLAPKVFAAADWEQYTSLSTLDTRYLRLSGGIMTGPLMLSGPPTAPLQAVTKDYADTTFATRSYVDATFATRSYVDATFATWAYVGANYLPLSGGTLTGYLQLVGDPPGPLYAATKQYTDTRVFRSGDTMTGTLATNANADLLSGRYLYATTAFYANSFNSWEWQFTVDGNGSKYQSYRSGWYDVWNGTNGDRSWNAPGVSNMYLSGGGQLTVRNNFVLAGGLGINYQNFGGHWFSFGWNGNLNIYVDGGYQGDAALTSWVVSYASGTYLPLAGGTVTGSLQVNSNLGVSGNLNVNGTLTSNNTLQTNTGISFQGQPPIGIWWDGYRFMTNLSGDTSRNLIASWSDGGNARVDRFTLNSSTGYGVAWFNNLSQIAGWTTTISDRRRKTNILACTLDALAVVRNTPVYTADMRMMPDAEPMHLEATLLADEVRKGLPSAVAELPDEAATLMLNPLHLCATLWRAMQQMDERVTHLEDEA